MTTPLEQMNITIHIADDQTVTYSYFDPIKKENVTLPTCDLILFQPSCCLFALDTTASSQGWTITQLLQNGTDEIDNELGPYGLSIGTACQDKKVSWYKFYIVYFNVITQLTFFEDPQEVNIPPMERSAR